MSVVQRRPAELGAFFVIAPAVYGWLVERGVPDPVAAVVGMVVGLVPAVISWWRDGLPEPGDPGDHVATGLPPVKKGKHESVGLNHSPTP